MNTAFVATLGGHISELEQLADRIDRNGDDVWITNDSPQTRDLLDGRRVEFVPFIGERDRIGVLRAVPQARRLYLEHGVDRVFSTGSAIALAYLPVAAAMGMEARYIESSTRVDSWSTTGRILSRTPGVRCHWQTTPAPSGFTPIGSVYDGFVATEIQGPNGLVDPFRAHQGRGLASDDEMEPAAIDRVVVTVGTTDRCFRRLISRLIEILPPDAEVLWQTGWTDVTGLGIEGREMVPQRELAAAMEKADVVVTHAGAGSLGLALGAGRAPVFVPRRAAHREHLDDHQLELARWAHRRGLAIHVEADRIELGHLQTAARRLISTKPAGKLVFS